MNIKNLLEHIYTPETYWYFHSNKCDIYTYVKELRVMLTLASPTPDAISIIMEEETNDYSANRASNVGKRSYTLTRESIQDYLDKVFANIKEKTFLQSTNQPNLAKDAYILVSDYLMTGHLPANFTIEKEKSEMVEDIILTKGQQKIYIRIGNAATNFDCELLSALQSLKISVVDKKQSETGVYFEMIIPRYEMEKSAILAPAFHLQTSASTEEQFIESLLSFENENVKASMLNTILSMRLENKPGGKKLKI